MKTDKDLDRKRKRLIPEIIEAYANIPLKGKPENLREIYKVFRSDSDILFGLNEEVINYKIHEIIELSNVNESNVDAYNERVKKLTKDLSQKSDIISKLMLKFSKELTYKVTTECGYYEIHYNPINPIVDDVYKYYFDVEPKSTCPCNAFRKNALDNALFNGPNRLKCFECDQKYFIYILDSINSGLIYNDIYGLSELFKGYNKIINYHLSVENHKLSKVKVGIVYEDRSEIKFPAVFDGLISNLLVKFLLDHKSNLKRIKRCPFCKKIFIATDSKAIKCYSDECVREYKTKQKQLERDQAKIIKNKTPHE